MYNKEVLATDMIPDVDGIVLSSWCVMCWPIRERAAFIFQGNGLCQKHFEE